MILLILHIWVAALHMDVKGYDGHETPENVSMHQFPLQDQPLLQKWLRKISRQDFVPSKNSKLCSLHFTDDCFITTSEDSNS